MNFLLWFLYGVLAILIMVVSIVFITQDASLFNPANWHIMLRVYSVMFLLLVTIFGPIIEEKCE